MFLNNIRRCIKKNPVKELPLKPISTKFGFDRGTPIDRVYIEDFLEKYREYISGVAMEIAEDTYLKQFGTNVKERLIFTNDKSASNAIIGDLQTGEGVQEGLVDSFILTQTLPFIFDIQSSVDNIIKFLKIDGHALITVRGISMISRYDESRWGDYWGFTKQSLRKLFADRTDCEILDLISYGNVKTAVSFLYGACKEELKDEDFQYNDDLFPVILGIVIKKCR